MQQAIYFSSFYFIRQDNFQFFYFFGFTENAKLVAKVFYVSVINFVLNMNPIKSIQFYIYRIAFSNYFSGTTAKSSALADCKFYSYCHIYIYIYMLFYLSVFFSFKK